MLEQMNEATAKGRLIDAARAFHTWVAIDNEIAALETHYFERCAGIVPAKSQISRPVRSAKRRRGLRANQGGHCRLPGVDERTVLPMEMSTSHISRVLERSRALEARREQAYSRHKADSHPCHRPGRLQPARRVLDPRNCLTMPRRRWATPRRLLSRCIDDQL